MTTILIVDDEEGIRLAFDAVLTHAGYTVHTTPSPEEALRLLDAHQPQLVLLDINLGSAARPRGWISSPSCTPMCPRSWS